LPAEYDLISEFTVRSVVDGDDPAKWNISEICAAGRTSFQVSIGFQNNSEYHLGVGNTPVANATSVHIPNLLDVGKKYRLVVHVRAKHVTVVMDNKAIIDQATNFQDMGDFGGPLAQGLNVSALICTPGVTFHQIQVLDVSGKGHLIGRWTAPTLADTPDYSGHANRVSLTQVIPAAIQGISWRNKVNGDLMTLTVLGKPCDDYLYLCAPFSGIYRIPENTIGFHAIEFRPPNVETRSIWRLVIYVDGDEAFVGECAPNRALDISLPIRKGAKTLEVRTDPMGGNSGKQCVLAFPHFIQP
jgi:hypothetical protein